MTRICRICQNIKELTDNNFRLYNGKKSKLYRQTCKVCDAAIRKNRHARDKALGKIKSYAVYAKRWRENHPEYKEKSRGRYWNNLEESRRKQREYSRKCRLTILAHYSGGTMSCGCCGESTYEFLTLDHINGLSEEEKSGKDGRRRKYFGTRMYSWLKARGFPEGYQVLCHNCNAAKGFYKVCPHKRKGTFD